MSKRLLKDIQVVKADADKWGFTCTPDEGDLTKLTCTIPGTSGTPYEGGVFSVKMEVPNEYPLKQPRAHFETPIYHPNVSSQTGAICIDILGRGWTPAYSIEKVLISLQGLLESPNADDPQDAQVAGVFKNDYPKFESTAKEWTRKHALPAKPLIDEAALAKFTQMGFTEEQVAKVYEDLGITSPPSEEEQDEILEKLLN